MNKIIRQNIDAFILAMKNEEYAKADRYLETVVHEKVKNIYSDEYEKVKKEYKKNK